MTSGRERRRGGATTPLHLSSNADPSTPSTPPRGSGVRASSASGQLERDSRAPQQAEHGYFSVEGFYRQRVRRGAGVQGGLAQLVGPRSGPMGTRQEGVQRAEGLIKYMTPEERRTPKLLILDPTSQARCRRIAKDAGVKLSAVSAFLKEFQSMQANMSRMGQQMANGDPNAAAGEPSPFDGMSGPATATAPSLNRQQRRQSKKNKGGRAAAPSKGFG